MSGLGDEELKRGRGRPKKEGARRKQMNLRVTEDFYNEVKELSELDGKSCVDYIIESVKLHGALTRVNNLKEKDSDDTQDFYDFDDDFDDFEDYEDYDFD